MGLRAYPRGKKKSSHHYNKLARKVGELLPNSYSPFFGKKNKIWIWTAVDHFKRGILDWVIGEHSAETFEPLWAKLKKLNCYFYVTDGSKVYPQFIPDGDKIIRKIYMTRVEGENTRLRHYLGRLH